MSKWKSGSLSKWSGSATLLPTCSCFIRIISLYSFSFVFSFFSVPLFVFTLIRCKFFYKGLSRRCDFTGTLIVVPDVGALNMPGASAESSARHRGAGDNAEGLRGLKALGVRDLNYRMSFLACGVSSAGSPHTSACTVSVQSLFVCISFNWKRLQNWNILRQFWKAALKMEANVFLKLSCFCSWFFTSQN